jgi:alkaline phosphatase/streptomycin-6-phosphatase
LFLAAGTAFATWTSGDRSDSIKRAIDDGSAKNIILFIGDGMGESEITVARNYSLGAAGKFPGIDAPTFTGDATTFAVQEADPSKPDYVTDSAASGTAWATGVKTSNNRVSTTPKTDLDVKTILELAQGKGWATGNVSTAEITDATPAVLSSHVRLRGCQGPADMATCPQDVKPAGPGSIAEQTVDHHVDVVLGGGKQRYDQKITGGPDAGKSVIESAERQGYKVVTNRADLLAYRGSKLLLGLFTAGNMTTEWNGALASPYPGSGPQRCNEANRPANEPTLAEMTRVAIDRLDDSNGRGWSWKKKRHESDGFFLQVEGASIDKQDHAQNPCAQIGETVAFDEAVQVGLAYAARHKDTLVIVTADHGHTSQIIEPQSATDHSPGAISTLVTADGVNMVVNYATNLNGRSQSHTGTQIRVAAQGPQAANVLGLVDQTDLFRLMKRAMGAS